MRRCLSILLVLVFSLGPLNAVLGAGGESRLPACCRRQGAHHCAMTAAAQPTSSPSISAPSTCPLYPGSCCAIFTTPSALAASAAILPVAAARAHHSLASRIAPLLSPIRAYAGRGPPQTV